MDNNNRVAQGSAAAPIDVQEGTQILPGLARIPVWVASNDSLLVTRIARRLDTDDDIDVLGYSPAEDARLTANLAERRPTVLLVDWLGSSASAYVTDAMKFHAALAPRVLLLVRTPTPALVEAILRHRLHGYLCADAAPRECGRAIRCVARGEIWMPRAALAGALADLLWSHEPIARSDRDIRDPDPCDAISSQITAREQQIIMLVRQGLTNKQIGRTLGIMEDTVKKHLQHVYDKLGVRRRTLLLEQSPTSLSRIRG